MGLSITITLFLGLKYYSHIKRIKWSLITAFFLTLFEGWLGAVLVNTVLNPVTITLHLFFALIIVMLLLYASQEVYYLDNHDAERQSKYPSRMQGLFGLLAITLLIEVILGTEIRGGLEMIRKDNPMVDSQFLLDMLGPFKYAHSILGFLITVLCGLIWYKLVKRSVNPSSLVVQTSTSLLVLIMLQIVSGEVLVFFDVIPLVQLFHLWIASWILGIISVQYCAWKRSSLINE